MSDPTPISGTAITLRSGPAVAEIASVGASIRSLEVNGRALVVPFAATELRPLYRGAVLAPWPNRVVDGAYSFGGAEQQLALTEPERGHALHGLVGWADFRVVETTPSSVALETTIVPQQGYPHRLTVHVEYRLTDDALATRITATNTGTSRAPYGTSAHPYLVGGPGRVDDWTLEVVAERVLEVDPDRLIPKGLVPVAGGSFDFREPRTVGGLFIDHAFTGIGADGDATVRVTAADGHGAELRWDAADAPWLQLHTADRPEPEYDRAGLAAEPMTCPPDAFNSGADLIVLEPGAGHTTGWTIAAI